MTELVLTRGLPGSGKTTWAKAWVQEQPERRARCNRDDLRASLFCAPRLSYAAEEVVTDVQRQTVATLLKGGRDVVIDDMHLRPRYVREWIRFARAHGADVRTVEMPADLELAISRDAARQHPVGADVIRGIATKYLPRHGYLPIGTVEDEQPTSTTYTGTPGKPAAIMVDIDGTVALMTGRSPYDLTRVHEDQANRAVIAAVWAAWRDKAEVLFCSGREASARTATEAWLREHVGIPDFQLFMRPEGDKRRDAIVKAELFDQHIRDHYDVLYVLDDRQQVVDMWRALGLTVLQVAPGDF